mgnify:CR=1 FL=1
MKRIMIITISCIIFTSCSTTKNNQDIPYKEAQGYFVRNDVTDSIPIYFAERTVFDFFFGCASVMGKGGLPTEIDFGKQSVIAVIGKETNRPTEYNPISLYQRNDTICLSYKSKVENPTTYTMIPVLLVIIDKPLYIPIIKLEESK